MIETHLLLWIATAFLTLLSKKSWKFAKEYFYVVDSSDALMFGWIIILITGISVPILSTFGRLIGRAIIFWMNYF